MGVRRAVVACALVVATVSGVQAQALDGRYWTNLSPDQKTVFSTGLLNGARYLGVLLLVDDPNWSTELTRAYARMADRYLAPARTGRIVEQLDAFYADTRHPRIPINIAAAIVLSGLAGMPAAQIEEKMNDARKTYPPR